MPEHIAAAARFVILAAPRSGSNQLCTLLNSHPEILCHHEVYNPSAIFYALDLRDGTIELGTRDERDWRPLEFLEPSLAGKPRSLLCRIQIHQRAERACPQHRPPRQRDPQDSAPAGESHQDVRSRADRPADGPMGSVPWFRPRLRIGPVEVDLGALHRHIALNRR